MNIHTLPVMVIPGDSICCVFCDGPNGIATRLLFWLDRESCESGAAAIFALDFATKEKVSGFLSLNLAMVERVLFHLNGSVGDDPRINYAGKVH